MCDGAAHRPGVYERWGKRPLELLVVLLLLLPGLPVLLLLSGMVALRLGRPVLFRQLRAGRNGQPFTLWKLRSMRPQRFEGEEDAPRLTAFGRRLRATGLDELPQLLHVLRGEMSLIGPRPLPPDYTPHFTARQRLRLRVRPGLLGLSVARGRNALPWQERLEWDARYAERVSLRGDVAAALGSLGVLLQGRGASAPGHATSPRLGSGN
ncbi:sugar transferase [Roseomonas elaeocarpi]|uniref:Sugar transferase n=1 Tax=Roseomonas elaeocarpi TaxID=907779 RepID=A0ABV6JWI5_9PROT